MDKSRIIQRGTKAKFQVFVGYEGFDMVDNEFTVCLEWGLRGQVLTIDKSNMITNDGGEYFIAFDTTDMVGKVIARCIAQVPNESVGGFRQEVDEQYLCFVQSTPCASFECNCQCSGDDDHQVLYERITKSDMTSAFSVLRDATLAWLRDVNGKILRSLNISN